MRYTLAWFVLATATAVGADPTFSQLPQEAPSRVRGEPAAKPEQNLTELFRAAPKPSWIWGKADNTNYRLSRTFTTKATKAVLRVSADNEVSLSINGQLVATHTEWQEPLELDVSKHLKPAGETNLIQADVRNAGGVAGFVLKMILFDADGKQNAIITDKNWQATPINSTTNEAVRIVKAYGAPPYGDVFNGDDLPSKIPSGTFELPDGFMVEKLFTVPKETLGSWVCMTFDNKGRIIASDQDKKGLVRITPAKIGSKEPTIVERLGGKISAAQGLLYANGSLYASCNGGPGSGLYRMRDTNGDDQFDDVVLLKKLNGGGEHGPHALRLSPDGQSIYVIAGNHTQPPEKLNASRLTTRWGEDHLLPRQWDAKGHAAGILAPGGWLAKTDFEGKTWELISAGYRNPYDFAFNADGEPMVYDADMEWDLGMPWYRPTRVSHAASGSEFGWRSGTGKWPSYYPDSLPPMVEIGPGSPVGVEFGYGTKFPAKYQKALYILDWTFGTIYSIHLEPTGASYTATKQEFLSRTPLPLTDLAIGPDGALYFTTGGRGAQSELFRVVYKGTESTTPVELRSPENPARTLRKQLENFHTRLENPTEAIELATANLGHEDRWVRYAARLVLEHQDVNRWKTTITNLSTPNAATTAAIALARAGTPNEQSLALGLLAKLTFAKLTEDEQLDLLRAYSLIMLRMGPVEPEVSAELLRTFYPCFPNASQWVNLELSQWLVYLKSESIVAKTVELLKAPSKPLGELASADLLSRNRGYGGSVANVFKNSADQQKLAYLFTLRNATAGWTLPLRKDYFAFMSEARSKSGGSSFQGFLTAIERDALSNATDSDRLAIEASGLRKAYQPKPLPKPKGPGRVWTTAEVLALEPKLKARDFKNGEATYSATRCVVCHRFGSDGGATGPDLSQVAGRFGYKDLVEAITEPSKIISDQYKATTITTTSGKSISGRVVSDFGGKLLIVTDPEDASKSVEVLKDDIETQKASPTSLMPGSLLDTLNENEVLDLFAYMLSRGDSANAMFQKRR